MTYHDSEGFNFNTCISYIVIGHQKDIQEYISFLKKDKGTIAAYKETPRVVLSITMLAIINQINYEQ